MVDRLSPERRSALMSRVGGKNTAPEMAVRHLVFGEGFRYRLHCKDLPGKPDLCFRARRKAIFVHGCYWHGHGCKIGRLPKSRLDFWGPKIEANQARDMAAVKALIALGWQSLTVWQCEIKETELLRQRIVEFLESP